MSEEKGRKFDQEKIRWNLFPFKALESTVRVLMLGSDKYDDDNWKYVEDCKRRYFAAAMRHLTVWHNGDTIDEESGESHLAHALCCLIFLAWHEENQTKEFLGTTTPEEYKEVTDDEVSPVLPPPLPSSSSPSTDSIPFPNPFWQDEQISYTKKDDPKHVQSIFENVISRTRDWLQNL